MKILTTTKAKDFVNKLRLEERIQKKVEEEDVEKYRNLPWEESNWKFEFAKDFDFKLLSENRTTINLSTRMIRVLDKMVERKKEIEEEKRIILLQQRRQQQLEEEEDEDEEVEEEMQVLGQKITEDKTTQEQQEESSPSRTPRTEETVRDELKTLVLEPSKNVSIKKVLMLVPQDLQLFL